MLRELVKACTSFTGATADAAAAKAGLAAAAAETAALRAELEVKSAKALQARAKKAGVPKPTLAAANAQAPPKVSPALRSDVGHRRHPHAGSPPPRTRCSPTHSAPRLRAPPGRGPSPPATGALAPSTAATRSSSV
jgi:hypothetical protein